MSDELRKGSASLYGKNELLGGIRKSEDGESIKKSNEKDELKKAEKKKGAE